MRNTSREGHRRHGSRQRVQPGTAVTEPIARAGKLAGAAAVLVFAAGAAGAVLLGDWQVAKLGLIAAMVTYVLASLVAITVRNLSGSAPVANSARAFSRWRRREHDRNWRRNIP